MIRELHLKTDCLCIDFNVKNSFQHSRLSSNDRNDHFRVNQFYQRSLPNLKPLIKTRNIILCTRLGTLRHWSCGEKWSNSMTTLSHSNTYHNGYEFLEVFLMIRNYTALSTFCQYLEYLHFIIY